MNKMALAIELIKELEPCATNITIRIERGRSSQQVEEWKQELEYSDLSETHADRREFATWPMSARREVLRLQTELLITREKLYEQNLQGK